MGLPLKKNYLLLTATIQPQAGQSQLLLANPQARYQEYRKALAFYHRQLVNRSVDGVIFAENSGYDLSALQKEFPHPDLEWISTQGLDYDRSFHRGYGEFLLVDHVHQVSKTLGQARGDDSVWKVSGRYILKNLKSVVTKGPKAFDLYIVTQGNWSEMSVMAWSVQGYQTYLKKIWPRFATPMAPELILSEEISRLVPQDPLVVTKETWPPYLIGKRGTSGTSYQGRFGPVKHLYKVCQRMLFGR